MNPLTALDYDGRAVYLPEGEALVLADVHVGRDADSPVELPLGEASDLEDRLSVLLDRFEPETVVFAGDLLHAFDRVPPGVEESLDRLRERIEAAGATVVVTPGNHDSMLTSFDFLCEDEVEFDDGTVVCHGHEAPTTDANRYVVGHDHPAIRIEGTKYPCYLVGEGAYRGADVVMLPAFNRLARGTVVNTRSRRDFQSPLVSRGAPLGTYRPVVWDHDGRTALEFPPLEQLRRLL